MLDEHRGKPLPDYLIRQIRRFRRDGISVRQTALLCGVDKATVLKYQRLIVVAKSDEAESR